MTAGIFVFGTLVFALVAIALGLIAWGILNERRDRTSFEQAREVLGDRAAALETGEHRVHAP